MKIISKLSIKLILCLCLIPVETYSQTICGEVGDNSISGSLCMESSYAYNDPNYPTVSLDTNFNVACANYSTSGYDPNHGISYLNDCYVAYGGYKCWNSNYYDDSGCFSCPGNKLASDNPSDNGHVNRSCDYCTNGSYMNDDSSNCLACPGQGQTSEDGDGGPAYAPSIESCFLPYDFENSNLTGSFIYINNCYWSK